MTSASPFCIQWKKPMFTSYDVTNITYNVSVTGGSVPPFNATTSELEYCQELKPCQKYNISVTPFSSSPDYVGASSTITYSVPGGNNHGYSTEENVVK